MPNAIKSLLDSRKFLLTMCAMLIGGVFVVSGKITIHEYYPLVAALTAILVGTIAIEDSAKHRRTDTTIAGRDVTKVVQADVPIDIVEGGSP